MNSIVQKSFDSLEASLATLIESVSSYNPSPAAAITVVNADDALTKSLEQCTSFDQKWDTECMESTRRNRAEGANGCKVDEHQQSYQKLLSLRATSETLDKQLTELLETLSEAREKALNVPMTKFPPSHGTSESLLLSVTKAKY